jgi:hypothetical protein
MFRQGSHESREIALTKSNIGDLSKIPIGV